MSKPGVLYEMLRIEPDADPTTVRTAYRRLARANHPDVGGDQHVMAALNKAWVVLGDPVTRRAYDRSVAYPDLVPDDADRPVVTPTSYQPEIGAPKGRSSGTVLDFGRYVGWSVGQLAAEDPDYLLWLERTSVGRSLHGEIQATLGARAQRMAADRR